MTEGNEKPHVKGKSPEGAKPMREVWNGLPKTAPRSVRELAGIQMIHGGSKTGMDRRSLTIMADKDKAKFKENLSICFERIARPRAQNARRRG